LGRPKKIIYLISHAGGGHRTAADAIETAIKEMRGEAAFNHKIVNIWSLGSGFHQFLGSKRTYAFLVKYIPFIYMLGFWFEHTSFCFNFTSSQIYKEIGKGMAELIKSEKPDLIVSVHPLGNHTLFKALTELKLINKIRTANVVIELITLHRAWTASREFDLITVPTKEAKEQFLKLGFPEEKIKLFGPLVRPQFLRDYGSREELRIKEGLDPDKFTILIMSGVEGFNNVFKLAKELDKINKDLQVVVLVSKNKKLIRRLEESRFKFKIKAIGFTSKVPQLMRASDILITKAGSVTISEALASSLPMIINSYIPGQESGNPAWIERNGFGKYVKNPRKIAETVNDWIESGKIKEYRENVKKFFNPKSTFEIVEEILKLIT